MNNNYRIKFKKGDIEFEVEGDKEFVVDLFENFKNDIENIAVSKVKTISSPNNKRDKKPPTYSNYTIQSLYKKLNPTSNLDRILIFAYWTLKTEKMEEFSTKDINDYFDRFKIKKPAYISRDFRTLVNPNKGYLITGNKEGFYSLSYDGINYIEEKLNLLEEE